MTNSTKKDVIRIFTQDEKFQQTDTLDSLDSIFEALQIAFDQGLAPTALRAPIFILWEVTGRCPQSCIYCYNRSPKRIEELSGKRIFQVADQLIEAKVFNVCLSGGEPTSKKEYLDLLEYLSSSGISVGTVLSGVRINEAMAARIARHASTVQISLDGSSPEVHDRVRRREGSFADAVNAIKLFTAEGKSVQVAFATTRFNIGDFPRFYDLCQSLGVGGIRTMKLVSSGFAADSDENIFPSDEEYDEFLKFCNSNGCGDPPVTYSEPTSHIEFGRKHDMSIIARITSEGYVSPSPYLDTFYGDLKKESFDQVWQKMKRAWAAPAMKEFLEKHVTLDDGVIGVSRSEYLFVDGVG